MLSGGRLERWSPIAGIAFVVLFIVGSVIFDDAPAPDASDGTILAYYADDGNQLKLEIASLDLTLAGVLFVWFAGSLSARLRRVEDEPGWLSRITLVSGAAFATMMLAGFALAVFVADAVDDNPDRFQIDPDTARLLTNASYTLVWETALPLAAPLVFAVSFAVVRTAFLPRWLGWAGLVVTLGCILGFLGVTMGLFLLWTVVVAVFLIRRAPAATEDSKALQIG